MPRIRDLEVTATSMWIQLRHIPNQLKRIIVANLREIPGAVSVTVSLDGDIHAFFQKTGDGVWATVSKSFFDIISRSYNKDFTPTSWFWARDTVAVYFESPVAIDSHDIISHSIQQLDAVCSVVWSPTADGLFIELNGQLTQSIQDKISSILSE